MYSQIRDHSRFDEVIYQSAHQNISKYLMTYHLTRGFDRLLQM